MNKKELKLWEIEDQGYKIDNFITIRKNDRIVKNIKNLSILDLDNLLYALENYDRYFVSDEEKKTAQEWIETVDNYGNTIKALITYIRTEEDGIEFSIINITFEKVDGIKTRDSIYIKYKEL